MVTSKNEKGTPRTRRDDALYARYSSHAQDDSTSVAVQIEACERAAGVQLRHFIDEAKTGRTKGGRTELLRLMQEAEAGRIGRLFVYKYDRLGRAAETHVLVDDLEQCGVEVISVTEGTNALARGVQLVVAADYSRVLAERTRAGLVQRHKERCWTGGPPPYGYRVLEDDTGKKRLQINPTEAETVRFIFRTYLNEAIGLKEVARRLRKRGVPTRLGGPWGFTTVRGILTNRMVIGEVRYLRRQFKLNRATGQRIPRWTDEDAQPAYEDESLRIVSDVEFNRVQDQLATNARRRPRATSEIRPFTRHLYCGVCGSVYYARKSKNAKGEYRYYGCGRRQVHGTEACQNRATVREDLLIGRVQTALKAVFEDMDGVIAEAVAMVQAALDESQSESNRLKAEIDQIDKHLLGLSRVLIDPEIEPIAKRAISRQLADHEAKREELGGALVRVSAEAAGDKDELLADCRQAFLDARESFAQMLTGAEMNRFVGEVVGPMTVLPDRRVVQKEAAPKAEAMGAASIAGAGLEPATSGL